MRDTSLLNGQDASNFPPPSSHTRKLRAAACRPRHRYCALRAARLPWTAILVRLPPSGITLPDHPTRIKDATAAIRSERQLAPPSPVPDIALS